ncbi:hypothetical protein INT43_001030 [Umbelopsis isabellina]|uniref:G domain-containing protein n=1 Tax=Mortierella isabellina TaxID=91625 RepID=A0A8H7PJY9_MORIS|nr:hypothetical protein INT43_001030 [Umbelopsis isabellina]
MATKLALMRIARLQSARTFTLALTISRKLYAPAVLVTRNTSITSLHNRRSLTTQVEQLAISTTHCSGCGAQLQDSDASAVGYYSPKAITTIERIRSSNGSKKLSDAEYEQRIEGLDAEMKELLGMDNETPQVQEDETHITTRKLCSRCHSLTHHKTSATSNSKEFLRSTLQHSSLSFLKTKNNALIVAVFDIGDIPFSMEPLVKHLTSNPTHRIMLVANKVDILPKKALNHQQRIRDWIVQQAKKNDIPTSSIVDVNLVSAVKGWGIKSLLRSIQDHRNSSDDVYVLGCTNVGKSALVNAFLKQGAAKKEDVSDYAKQHTARVRRDFQVTTSNIPGTTIGSIKIPLRVVGIHNETQNANNRFVTKDHYMVDTPGVVDENQLVHMVPADQLKKWELRKELKPVTYRLDVGKSLLLKPFMRLDLINSSRPVLVTLFTNMVPHIVKTEKLEDKETSDMDGVALKPLSRLIKLDGYHPSHATADIALSSMGWVSLTGEFNDAALRAWIPSEANENVVTIRTPPLLPYEYKGSIRKFYGSGERSRQ